MYNNPYLVRTIITFGVQFLSQELTGQTQLVQLLKMANRSFECNNRSLSAITNTHKGILITER